jgi:SIR2-like domain
VTPVPRSSVREMLDAFRDDFPAVVKAFVQGDYQLWLGSGLSREVVPDLRMLLKNLLFFLQSQVDVDDEHCRFRRALSDVLFASGIPSSHRTSIDLTALPDTWSNFDDLLEGLIDKYADVLDVIVDGEDADFLVWTGLDVATTYGASALKPDVEHLCVAILMLEGVVKSAPTTNWDGLVESAIADLTAGAVGILKVVVQADDFSAGQCRAELVKFHGCAVRAANDPAHYRSRLIARSTQIAGWTAQPENRLMKQRLEFLLASQPVLVVGMSAQDANIHTMLHTATQNLPRDWSKAPPSVIFAEQRIGHHQQQFLKATYGDGAYSTNRNAIDTAALLGAFAKPTLVALVLVTLEAKLCSLLERSCNLPSNEFDSLKGSLREFCNVLGDLAKGGTMPFVLDLISGLTLVLSIFRSGKGPVSNDARYQPLSIAPIGGSVSDPNFPIESLARLALVLSLLCRGHMMKSWELAAGIPSAAINGAIRARSASGPQSRVFLVQNSSQLSRLEADGVVDMSNADVLVLHSDPIPRRATRSPSTRFGRTGKTGARELDLVDLVGSSSSADELFDKFKLVGSL